MADGTFMEMMTPEHLTRANRFLTAVNVLNATHGGVGSIVEDWELESNKPVFCIFTELNNKIVVDGLLNMAERFRFSRKASDHWTREAAMQDIDKRDALTAEQTTATVFIGGPDYEEVEQAIQEVRALVGQYDGQIVLVLGLDEIEIGDYNLDLLKCTTEGEGDDTCHYIHLRVTFE